MQWLSMLSAQQSPVLLSLLVAALCFAGAALLEISLRLRRRAFLARAALIAPWTGRPTTVKAGIRLTSFRRNTHAVGPSRTERIVAWLVGRLGIAERFAPLVDAALRPAAAIFLSVGVWFLAPLLVPFTQSLGLRALLAGGAGILGWFLPVLAGEWWASRYRDRKSTRLNSSH